ncbi:M23 family metallopeptidase [Rhodohalobacter sp.]|uniref:M23 family metallopeptidase n=1 Tax=Rhodohalobacter sp. TaxID=1974210 RepID=UPI002ACDCFED|nr:peptidoglycan DD-metalloendopeptidase family protein [Rhodohalobacter sp.]MDZ7757584.1 peptidoglycan DD-metalloendopeptidase family protein [Rhodohalobacter sp.]
MSRTLLIGFVCLLVALTVALLERPEKVEDLDEDIINAQNFYEIPPLPGKDIYGFITEGENIQIEESAIRRNESLYTILRKHDIDPQTIYNIQQKATGIINLRRMIPGQKYRIYKNEGEAFAMVWHQSKVNYAIINWLDDIHVETGMVPINKEEAKVTGVITSSLYETVVDAGVSRRLGAELADVFGWEIDFFGLRSGDHFKVIYENLYANGEYLGIGDIIAAEFQHRGRVYKAYYFENESRRGFFNENGDSMQKELLKAPFRYSQRISSNFSNSRFHPILNQRRPHYGTDYAAPTGTPIISVGEGVVIEAQRRGGNGNIVQIRHNNSYKTAYLHLNGFAPGIRQGAKVEQGQVIGYVGQTGLATGPHLCYRLYVDDRPVNSITVDLPAADSLEEKYYEEFRHVVDTLDSRLNELKLKPEIALN